MADRRRGKGEPEKGTPEYDWLYGSDDPARGAPGDPEPTRMLPTLNRPSARGGGRAGPPPPSRGSTRRRPRLGWLKLVLLLWLVFLVAVPVWAWTQIEKVDAEPDDARPDSQPGHTYLLVGSDSREGLTREERQRLGTGRAEGQRTDTIMLLHTGSGPNLLLSIPRDSIVDVPGYGRTKVNAAYAYGGPELLVQTLEDESGVRIDSYVEIGLGGFVNVIDAVGGIEICPKTAMNDRLAKLKIEKGCQEVDGPTALGYARSRKLSQLGDIDRAQRQREVVSAVGAKAASPWSVLNPVRYANLGNAGSKAVRLGEDTGPFDTARFGWAMTRVTGDKGLTCGVPIADLAVNWDSERALQMFGYIKEDRTADIPKSLCTPSGLEQ